MKNAELIKALRCESVINDEHPRCESCKYGVVVCHGSREDVYGCDSRRIENDAAAALEAAEKRIAELEAQEPTEKQVVDYCHKRCFVIVEGELFQRMKATYAQIPKRGEWIGVNPMVDTEQCSLCGWNIPTYEFETNYCPNCGAKMRGEHDEQ